MHFNPLQNSLDVAFSVFIHAVIHLTVQQPAYSQVVAFLSGSMLILINVVALHWARLILGWVTICGWVNHLDM